MHILFMTHTLHPRPGGVERSVHHTALALVRAGHDVTVLCRPEAEREAVPYTILPLDVEPRPPWTRIRVWNWMWAHRSVIAAADVLHFHDWSTFIHWYLPLLPVVRSPIRAITFHGYDSWPPRKWHRVVRRWTASCMDLRFAVGSYLQNLYRESYTGIYLGGATVREDCRPRQPRVDLVYIGRWEEDTGLPEVLNALDRHAQRRDRRASVALAGQGSLGGRWTRERYPHLTFELHGPVADPSDLYRAARIVIPSGFLSLFDACALGCPRLLPLFSPLRQAYFRSVPGIEMAARIVDRAEALDQAFDDLLVDDEPAETQVMEERGRELVRIQTWDRVASLLLDQYHHARTRVS